MKIQNRNVKTREWNGKKTIINSRVNLLFLFTFIYKVILLYKFNFI